MLRLDDGLVRFSATLAPRASSKRLRKKSPARRRFTADLSRGTDLYLCPTRLILRAIRARCTRTGPEAREHQPTLCHSGRAPSEMTRPMPAEPEIAAKRLRSADACQVLQGNDASRVTTARRGGSQPRSSVPGGASGAPDAADGQASEGEEETDGTDYFEQIFRGARLPACGS